MARRRVPEHNLSASPEPSSESNTKKEPDFRVATDFGTTMTTIAFTIRGRDEVFTIEEFPGDKCNHRNGTQVPTEIWYLSDSKRATPGAKQRPEGTNVLYGYEIIRRLELPEDSPLRVAYKDSGLVTKPKLLLDDSAQVVDMRKSLMDVLNHLKKERLIKKDEDVIERLLVCYLKHTKSVLERDHGLNDDSKVEMTLAVPVCWSAGAIAVMSSCLRAAMATTRFGTDGKMIPRLFIVNEAEAAAVHAIDPKNTKIEREECFIMLDCGGGTTDAGTYQTDSKFPLRLNQEVHSPKGVVCGSSDLNARMRLFAALQLKDEHYLVDEDEGLTIANIIDAEIMPQFESEDKRAFDITKSGSSFFRIRGLRQSDTNPRLHKNSFELTSEDLHSIFYESLQTIERLMLEQIEGARRNHVEVKKVVLVGGFGDSPALKEHLRVSLQRVNNQYNTNVELINAAANTSAIGVARGAVMRAQDKRNGPLRNPCRSIGVLHHVRDEDGHGYSQEVLAQKWSVCELTQEEYIMRTIKWIIKANAGELKAVHEFEFESMHCFSPDWSKWIAGEALYASDACVEDFFTRQHVKNRGKTSEFGLVEFDVTHLKDQIKMYTPSDTEEGSERFEVTLRVRMTVIDRYMEFAAYWPANDKNAAAIQGSQKGFDISSAFRPGTA